MERLSEIFSKREALEGLIGHAKSSQKNKLLGTTIILLLLLFAETIAVAHAETYSYINQWDCNGSEHHAFQAPGGIAIDGNGFVYVTANGWVQKFDSNGTLIANVVTSGGVNGLDSPEGIAIDNRGNIYIADSGSDRVQKFDSNGTFIASIGAVGKFNHPVDVAVDGNGYIYVTDPYESPIQKFDGNGKFITKIGSYGNGNGKFSGSDYNIYNGYCIAIDSSGDIYVTDPGHRFVQKFDSNGTFITKWGSYGTSNGQFDGIQDIAIDRSGNIYITDFQAFGCLIQKFDSNGTFITKWGSYGTSNGQFRMPWSIAVDEEGSVYVGEFDNYRIQKFEININPTVSVSPSNQATTSGESTTYTLLAAVAILLLIAPAFFAFRKWKKR